MKMTTKMMRCKPMLAQPVGDYSRITKEDWENGLYIQPKLDGVRCMIQYEEIETKDKMWTGFGYQNVWKMAVKAYSRTSKEWLNIDHILEQLYPFFIEYPNIVLDGELYNHELKDDFEKIISLVRKTKPTDEDRLESADKVQFHCYDFVGYGGDYLSRLNFLDDKFSYNAAMFPKIKTLNTFEVYNTEEVEVKHEDFLELGYEGSILRKNAPYECKRSWNLQKVKDFSDAEATIIGYSEGKGKRTGHLGKFVMKDSDGIEFGCPPGKGYNYYDLEYMLKNIDHYIGKKATFTYFERTKKGSYRHPLFKSIRDYE